MRGRQTTTETTETMKKMYLEKARRTHQSHSRGYAKHWGKPEELEAIYRSIGHIWTGDFGKDYHCSVEDLAKAFEREDCPHCGRTYEAIAAEKNGVDANPLRQRSFHISAPNWIVVCRSCHPKIERKPASEWKRAQTDDRQSSLL